MNPNFTQLSQPIVDILKKQVQHELLNSNRYLALSHFCDAKQYLGSKKFFEKHSDEEKGHMKKIVSYLIDKKVSVNVPMIEEVTSQYNDLVEVFNLSLGFEKDTTANWKEIAMVAFKKRDFMTFDLAQWFIREQVEEEALFINILDRWETMKDMPSGQYFLDCDIEKNYL